MRKWGFSLRLITPTIHFKRYDTPFFNSSFNCRFSTYIPNLKFLAMVFSLHSPTLLSFIFRFSRLQFLIPQFLAHIFRFCSQILINSHFSIFPFFSSRSYIQYRKQTEEFNRLFHFFGIIFILPDSHVQTPILRLLIFCPHFQILISQLSLPYSHFRLSFFDHLIRVLCSHSHPFPVLNLSFATFQLIFF